MYILSRSPRLSRGTSYNQIKNRVEGILYILGLGFRFIHGGTLFHALVICLFYFLASSCSIVQPGILCAPLTAAFNVP